MLTWIGRGFTVLAICGLIGMYLYRNYLNDRTYAGMRWKDVSTAVAAGHLRIDEIIYASRDGSLSGAFSLEGQTAFQKDYFTINREDWNAAFLDMQAAGIKPVEHSDSIIDAKVNQIFWATLSLFVLSMVFRFLGGRAEIKAEQSKALRI